MKTRTKFITINDALLSANTYFSVRTMVKGAVWDKLPHFLHDSRMYNAFFMHSSETRRIYKFHYVNEMVQGLNLYEYPSQVYQG
jgi:5-keto 4-deoxyuronate isomerase